MSWESVLKAPRPSKNMTEGVKKIYVLLDTDDPKKLRESLENYMKENGDNHFKRTANQLMSKLRYVAFPSFFRDPPISIDNIHEGKDKFRPKDNDGKKLTPLSAKKLSEKDSYYQSPQMVHTEKYRKRLEKLLEIYEKNFYKSKPMLTKLVKQGDFDNILRYMKGEVDFDAVEYIKNRNVTLKPRGKNKKLTENEKELRNRDISKLFKDRDIQKTLMDKYKDNPEMLGYSLSDDLVIVMPLSDKTLDEDDRYREADRILTSFTKTPTEVLGIQYRGNQREETEDETEDEKGSIDAQKEKDVNKPKQKSKNQEGYYIGNKKIPFKNPPSNVIGLTKFAPFLSVDEINLLAGSVIFRGKIERTQLAKMLGLKTFDSVKLKPKTTTDTNPKLISEKKDEYEYKKITDNLALNYFTNIREKLRTADHARFFRGSKDEFYENIKMKAFQNSLIMYLKYDANSIEERLDDMIISNTPTMSKASLIYKLKMFFIVESLKDSTRKDDYDKVVNSFNETNRTQLSNLLLHFKNKCSVGLRNGEWNIVGWKSWLNDISDIRAAARDVDDDKILLSAFDNILKDLEDLPTLKVDVFYETLEEDTRDKILAVFELLKDGSREALQTKTKEISPSLNSREFKRFIGEYPTFEEDVGKPSMKKLPKNDKLWIKGDLKTQTKNSSIYNFKTRYLTHLDTGAIEDNIDNEEEPMMTLDTLPNEKKYKLEIEYKRLIKFSRNIDSNIGTPNFELREMFNEIDTNKNREIDENETDRADVIMIKKILLKRFDSIKKKIFDEIKISMITVSNDKLLSKPKTKTGKTQGFKPLEWLNSKGI
jgi:hypothetical protein